MSEQLPPSGTTNRGALVLVAWDYSGLHYTLGSELPLVRKVDTVQTVNNCA